MRLTPSQSAPSSCTPRFELQIFSRALLRASSTSASERHAQVYSDRLLPDTGSRKNTDSPRTATNSAPACSISSRKFASVWLISVQPRACRDAANSDLRLQRGKQILSEGFPGLRRRFSQLGNCAHRGIAVHFRARTFGNFSGESFVQDALRKVLERQDAFRKIPLREIAGDRKSTRLNS